MTKNQWDVEVVTDAEDFSRWDWGEDYGEAHEAFVREISVEAAKVVNAELVKDVMFDLRTTETGAMIHVMLFGGDLEFCYPFDTLVTEVLESFGHDGTGTIDDQDERQNAERLIAQLERAAARIRDALG